MGIQLVGIHQADFEGDKAMISTALFVWLGVKAGMPAGYFVLCGLYMFFRIIDAYIGSKKE